MHCELVVPALFAPPGQAGEKALTLPALERLLARGRPGRGEARSPERWLLEHFGCAGHPLAAGALTAAAAGKETGDAMWARADPVHLQLGRDSLKLIPAGAFSLRQEEADALCVSLNQHFPETLVLMPVDPVTWCARLNAPAAFSEEPPLALAGADVDERLRTGAIPHAWHAFLNEAQMLLHAHPVNEAREARGEPVVNSLWLWGSGAAPEKVQASCASVSAHEPVALGLARLAAARPMPLPASAADWLRSLPGEGRHLVVLDPLRHASCFGDAIAYQEALRSLERLWFAPLLQALKENRIGMVSTHVPDAAEWQSFETVRGDLRRIWRRARPVSHYSTRTT